jgi:hypothetical protein
MSAKKTRGTRRGDELLSGARAESLRLRLVSFAQKSSPYVGISLAVTQEDDTPTYLAGPLFLASC